MTQHHSAPRLEPVHVPLTCRHGGCVEAQTVLSYAPLLKGGLLDTG